MYLQYRVDLIGTNGNSVRIHRVAVGDMNATSIAFAGDFRVDPLIFLPIYGGTYCILIGKGEKAQLNPVKLTLFLYWI